MRDAIVRALLWVLSALIPCRAGRHSAEHFATRTPDPDPDPDTVNPWSRPWNGPSSTEVRAIFNDDWVQELPALQRERLWAAQFAAIGVDYDFPTMPLGSVVTRERVIA
ncbi:hypothetical protein EASAB2608_04339 [Streptomyces sp. EAS-AB2608]|nr:hypothetical protein EASAB2608_04339 [Streptomyces sp. EAS-AB2608]CUW30637.1 hypothetical protein TUE45_05371 [Streptomyces reticuli]